MAKAAQKQVTAFVMMGVSPGEAHSVVRYLRKWAKRGGRQKGAYVKAAWVVTGAHDAIAMVEADTNQQLLELVTTIVRGSHHSPGKIISTQTAVAADGLWG